MDNNELLNQVLAAMQEQTEMLTRMVKAEVSRAVDAAETRINLKIENEVTGRIDSLFDGYKLAHEKQWELEHRMLKLESRLDRLETKVG